jgi:hypothetical protein
MSDWEVEKPQVEPKSKSATATVGDVVGNSLEDAFLDFDLSEVQKVVSKLQSEDTPTLAQAERLQQEALRAADVLSEHLAKLHKTIHYLTAQASSKKNKIGLEYEPPEGTRGQAIDLRKMAGESSQEVLNMEIKLAKAKGAKTALERKYEIIIKSHHHYKDIASGLRKTIQGYNIPNFDSDTE